MIEETDQKRNIESLRKGARVLWDLGGLPTFSPAAIAETKVFLHNATH